MPEQEAEKHPCKFSNRQTSQCQEAEKHPRVISGCHGAKNASKHEEHMCRLPPPVKGKCIGCIGGFFQTGADLTSALAQKQEAEKHPPAMNFARLLVGARRWTVPARKQSVAGAPVPIPMTPPVGTWEHLPHINTIRSPSRRASGNDFVETTPKRYVG